MCRTDPGLILVSIPGRVRQLFQEGTEIRKMTIAFITSMVRPGSGVKNMRKTISWTERVWQRYEEITGQPRPAIFQRPKADDEE